MSFEPKRKVSRISPIERSKSLLSNGDEEGALDALKKGAEKGNVMACHDMGFMMIQGIGCERDLEGGLELISRGKKLEQNEKDMSWKLEGSVTELMEPQSMNLLGEFLFLVFWFR